VAGDERQTAHEKAHPSRGGPEGEVPHLSIGSDGDQCHDCGHPREHGGRESRLRGVGPSFLGHGIAVTGELGPEFDDAKCTFVGDGSVGCCSETSVDGDCSAVPGSAGRVSKCVGDGDPSTGLGDQAMDEAIDRVVAVFDVHTAVDGFQRQSQ
jgi:hypothetical protein